MAGVSDTPGFEADLGPPKWQVYQIHLALKPILDPQNGRCIRYTWLCSRSWAPKMAGVSDTPGFEADLGPPKWQVYQIHLALKPILDPQNGRCIRYTWLCSRSWTPKMAGVSDTRLIIHARDITKKTMCVEQLVYVTSRYFKQLPLKQGSTSGAAQAVQLFNTISTKASYILCVCKTVYQIGAPAQSQPDLG